MNSKDLCRIIRRIANGYVSEPISLIDGDSPPRCVGQKWHYTTPKGDYVFYPNAYMRKFGRPIYHPSSRRIEVGREWAMHKGLATHVLTNI